VKKKKSKYEGVNRREGEREREDRLSYQYLLKKKKEKP
jgi:hypothetical protein